MHKTRIDLDKKVRKTVIGMLASRLADSQDLFYQIKQAHWAVRGPGFISHHELFDKLAGEIEGHMDDLAERIGQLGGMVDGTIAAAAKGTSLTAYKAELVDGVAHLAAVADALAEFGARVRADIDKAAAAGDAGSADLLTEISRGVDKSLWFVEAHLQAEK